MSAVSVAVKASVTVEKIAVTLRLPVDGESPERVLFHLYSQTYGSSMTEYFDTPESLETLANMMTMFATAWRAMR